MTMKNDKAVIIIKKRKAKGHAGHHGGSWKIAYADFMTAMMAFFLVMWIISISSPQEIRRMAEYFRMPLKIAIQAGKNLGDGESFIPSTEKNDFYQSIDDTWSDHDDVPENEEERLKKLRSDLESMIEVDSRLKEMKKNLLIDITDEGLQIQIIDGKNRPMFASGSATLDIHMRKILYALAPILNSYPNKFSIAGHTDNRPFSNVNGMYSNWELSADRANSSRRVLVNGGLDEEKILRVVGMASSLPLKQDGSEAENRRITIIVLNKASEEQIMKQKPVIPKEIKKEQNAEKVQIIDKEINSI